MISFVNSLNYNKTRLKKIGGLTTGIWKHSDIISTLNSYPLPFIFDLSSDYSYFEKFVENDATPMSYHLCGYGTLLNETICGFLGESAERYSFAVLYKLIKHKIYSRSIDEIIKEKENSISELALLNIFSNDNKLNLKTNEKISWVDCCYLNDLGKTIAIPLQFIISASDKMIEDEKRFLNSAVSTGTACQESFEKALEAAIIEIEQIDSFNLWWYGGLKGDSLNVDLSDLLNQYFKNKNFNKYFLENFEVSFTDISFDKNMDIVVCEIFSKNPLSKLPKYTVGVQGSKSLSKSIYRSFMEAMAVLNFNFNYPWIYPEKYEAVKETQILDNLDSNVVWYSKYGKPKNVKHSKVFSFKKSKDYNLIKDICKFGKTGFLDISLPEFADLNLSVVRVINANLLPICLPSYPPNNHPRYKQFDGISNFVPHPLA